VIFTAHTIISNPKIVTCGRSDMQWLMIYDVEVLAFREAATVQ
jgi:hypothetical protein